MTHSAHGGHVARLLKAGSEITTGGQPWPAMPAWPASEETSDQVSHRTSRGTWVPIASGLAAVIAISGATPALANTRGTVAPVAAARTSAGSLAGSLVRDVVIGAAVLIVLMAVLLVVMRSRRNRTTAEAGRGRPRGQHEQRRPERAPGRGLAAAGPAPSPDPAAPGLPPGVVPEPGGAPPAAASWRPAVGWQGTSVGEIATPRPVAAGPAVAPAPKPPRAGGGPPRKPAGPSGPPWAPAPEPERLFGPLPVAANSAMMPDPGPGIRLPGDMTSLAGSSPDGPAAGDFPRSTAPDPDFPPRPAADRAGPGQDGHPTQASLGFAAAPIQADYVPPETDATVPSAPDFTVPSRAAGFVLSGAPGPSASGSGAAGSGARGHGGTVPALRPAPEADTVPGPAADPTYIWDLAGHDVFPTAAPAGSPASAGRDSSEGQDPE
jgi:hypothetical protein